MNKKNDTNRMDKKLLICMTHAQYEELKQKAAAVGLTVSEYIRRMVLA